MCVLDLLSMICGSRTVHVFVWGKGGVSLSGGCLPPDHAESWVQVEVGVVSLQEAWSPQLKVGCWTVTIGKEISSKRVFGCFCSYN